MIDDVDTKSDLICNSCNDSFHVCEFIQSSFLSQGLFGRGLRTRILGNALQSVLFTVIWRGLAERKNDNQNQIQDKSRRSLKEEISSEDYMEKDIPGKDVPLEEERF